MTKLTEPLIEEFNKREREREKERENNACTMHGIDFSKNLKNLTII